MERIEEINIYVEGFYKALLLKRGNMKNQLIKLLGQLSYHNAAEGSWEKERASREKCSSNIKELVKSMQEEGILLSEIFELHRLNRGLTSVSDLISPATKLTTYRLMEKDDKGNFKTLFHGINGSKIIPLGKTLFADHKQVRDGSGKKWYDSGFHSIETLPLLYKYLKFFKRRREKLVIGVVEVQGLFGKPNSREGVILSSSQKLIMTHCIDWSRVE